MEIPILIDVGSGRLIDDGVDRLDGESISDAEVRVDEVGEADVGGNDDELLDELKVEEELDEEEEFDSGGVDDGDEDGGDVGVEDGTEVGVVEIVVGESDVGGGNGDVGEDVGEVGGVVDGSRDMVVVVDGEEGREGTSTVVGTEGVGVDDGACLRDKALNVVAWASERVGASEEESTGPTQAKEAEQRAEVLDPTTGVTPGARIVVVNEETGEDKLQLLQTAWSSPRPATDFPRADSSGGGVG